MRESKPTTRRSILLTGGTITMISLAGCSGGGLSIRQTDGGVDIQFEVDDAESGDGSGDTPPTDTPSSNGVSGGSMSASWTLIDADSGDELTCAEAGAAEVSILVTHDDGIGYDSIFDCSDQRGQTEELPLGEYQVLIYLLDSDGTVLEEYDYGSATLGSAGDVHDLGAVEFTIS